MPLVNLTTPEAIGDAEQCVVVTWLKREGDEIEVGETILELQAAKVSFDVPSPIKGRLVKILANQGDVIDWGQVLAHLEAIESSPAGEGSNLPPIAAGELQRPATASPIAARIAAEKGIDLNLVTGSGPNGRITEKDVYSFINAQEKPAPAAEVLVSPAAKRLAREHKIDVTGIKGTGTGGRITEADVLAAIEQQAADKTSAPNQGGAGASRTEIPLAGMRGAIAQRMLESVQTTAQLTLHTEADVSELVARHALDKQQVPPITYTDYIVRACAQALQQHPGINAHLDGSVIRVLPQINIGLAVSLDVGLIVPVLFNADTLSVSEIARERNRVVERARTGKLTPPEYSGGTFTVTNLGSFDIDGFTPILNPPELAILGVGRIVEKVVIHQGKIAQRHRLTLSLTIDHRIIDGVPGAAFLKTIKQLLESAFSSAEKH